MTTRREVEDTRQTIKGLALLARKLGYKDSMYQLQLDSNCSVGDILEFFEDNPGAIGAVVEWVLANNDSLTDEDDAEEGDEDGDDEDE